MNEEMRTIEINGIKMEVDMRTAKKIESYKVGDSVRVLVKNYNGYDVKYGVIVDFADFAKLPTIEILAVDPSSYNSDPLQFYVINANTEELEIAPLGYMDHLFKRDDVLQKMDASINSKEEELRTMKQKREVFNTQFGAIFEKKETVEA